jgi:hypothetical protein
MHAEYPATVQRRKAFHRVQGLDKGHCGGFSATQQVDDRMVPQHHERDGLQTPQLPFAFT